MMNSPRLTTPGYPQLKKTAAWREDQVVVFEIENTADYMVNIRVVFSGKTRCGREVKVQTGVFPHWPARFAFPLAVAGGKTLFLQRTPGRFKSTVQGANVAFEDLEEIRIDIAEGAEGDVIIRNLRLEDRMPTEYIFPDHPLVDNLHQWMDKNWPGKAKSIEAVATELKAELSEPEPVYPENWSTYGGWKEKTFDATGFFRIEKTPERWWLVDPDGYAFWSIGIDCVRYGNGVNVTGIESFFEAPLPKQRGRPELWEERLGDILFEAKIHNLTRALGTGWKEDWLELTRRRMIKYRFNTIANWSDRELQKKSRLPYVFTMKGYPQTRQLLFRDFPDVYAPEYMESCERFASQLHEIAGDPCVIGYFMTNEPKWAFVGEFDLGAQLLRDGGSSATLDHLIARLKEKYGKIEGLNAAWGSDLTCFDDLRIPHRPEAWPGCSEDTLPFTREAVERYVRLPAAACRKVDANHLNLGLRWAWIHSDYQLAGADILDAFSINCYQLAPDAEMVADLVQRTGKPLMIGEFHIGALDRGLPSGGIRNTLTMGESVLAYQHYVEQAATVPGLVGVHYFKWDDQHIMGRFDGENMQIGLHDITDRAYPEWRDMTVAFHPGLYEIIDGRRTPSVPLQKTVPQGTLVW